MPPAEGENQRIRGSRALPARPRPEAEARRRWRPVPRIGRVAKRGRPPLGARVRAGCSNPRARRRVRALLAPVGPPAGGRGPASRAGRLRGRLRDPVEPSSYRGHDDRVAARRDRGAGPDCREICREELAGLLRGSWRLKRNWLPSRGRLVGGTSAATTALSFRCVAYRLGLRRSLRSCLSSWSGFGRSLRK